RGRAHQLAAYSVRRLQLSIRDDNLRALCPAWRCPDYYRPPWSRRVVCRACGSDVSGRHSAAQYRGRDGRGRQVRIQLDGRVERARWHLRGLGYGPMPHLDTAIADYHFAIGVAGQPCNPPPNEGPGNGVWLLPG